ncbi:hypothetical protein [uncultured Bacteroides sp.]|uniref:hypothetical protein n=1 Tax=uncultured Bacteroides sp. TaxID=162156 RepID=UPI0026760DD2|nr:hypothetical protein [uncultured Bacteroides sp.]
MNIQELILAGLQQKFTGVDTAILTRIAAKKAEGVTDEAKVNSIVEGISFSDVLNSYGDFRAGDASKTAVTNYEKKHGLKEGKPIENPNPQPKPGEEKKDDVPAWAQAIIDSNKTLSEKLVGYEQERVQAQRNAQVSAKAKEYGIPETLVPMLNIPNDTDLDVFMKDAKQTFVNAGFQGVQVPQTAEQRIEKENHDIAVMINKGTEEINKRIKN